ncbi:hypothetical protein BDA96_10G262200 [Sorghum bicolor]|uniref:Uncharacterized protein n=1 Tax=Sorghum bicolor TaxID=4558 RepID=A0A921Q587_SORBI|nr:hypothetical protein BDA96_10G262200 [Sorghum bicolor]
MDKGVRPTVSLSNVLGLIFFLVLRVFSPDASTIFAFFFERRLLKQPVCANKLCYS